ncbi:MAG: gluconate 2-dehydrogenase subunit 3 family protein [Gammaproteobacteria bacterium]|jgi:gluconate 2-dehydrogenase gamma chain
MSRHLSRRSVLKRLSAVGAAASLPRRVISQTQRTGEPYENLSPSEAETLEAMVGRLIPSDENGPGALEAGAVRYIDRGFADALAASRDIYTAGLSAIDDYARRAYGNRFAELDENQQDAILESLENDAPARTEDATAFPPNAGSFFDLVLQHTLEGTFGDPYYGGNDDFIGWAMLGYPGLRLGVGPADQALDATPVPTRISAYDLPMFDPGDTEPEEA